MAKRLGQPSRRTAAQMHALATVQRHIRSHDPVSGRKYVREFTEAYQTYEAVLQPEHVEQRISAADLVLIGDYHALAASQRFAAEMIEKCARERRVVLTLEVALARDQRILDAWWRREISEEELRRRLRFDREWGYPWEPVFGLLCTARDHADGLYGLDCVPRQDMRRIRSRDRHAAAKVREVRERHPGAAIFVLFGESHMAPKHLPYAIRQLLPEQKMLIVLQNADALYWQTVGQQASAVSLDEDAICVFNSSPLEKYESYRLCLERWRTAKNEQEDFAPAIYNLIFSLARSVGFRLDSPRNETQPRFLADSLPEVVTVSHLPEFDDVTGEEPSCLYVAGDNTLLIREFQIAEAASECARFLHFACRGMTEICPSGERIESALARFASLLVCPNIDAESPDSELGALLYKSYVAGNIADLALRRIFLAHLETREQVEVVQREISNLIQN